MKKFICVIAAALCMSIFPFTSLGAGVSASAEGESVGALKARIAELETDLAKMRQLREENKLLRRQLRKVRTELFDLQASSNAAPKKAGSPEIPDAEAKINAEEKKILETEKEIKEKSKREPETIWEWLTL